MAKFTISSFDMLKNYCESEKFKGWDPFDGLNSKLFQNTPFKNSRFFRLAWLQLFKRNPINLRKILGVEKDFNAKGLGLFLTGYCNLYLTDKSEKHLLNINILKNKIYNLQSTGYSGSCWGYNFDWQARAFFQPKGTPTVVATSFISNALLDAYDVLKEEKLLKAARSSCDFILNDLNKTHDNYGNYCFSYSPLDNTQVFNATVLGSRVLARVYSITREEDLKTAAKKSIDFCIPYQKEDGAWPYGTLPYHQWVDSFHTGYMIECISEYQNYAGGNEYDEVISKSLDYYLDAFFEDTGTPKYYNNKRYPVDIHAPAQLIVTLFRISKIKDHKELIDKVLNWVFSNMWDPKGYFYYQKHKFWTSKIPYIRWSQAWMFYTLSYYQRAFVANGKR